MYVGTELIFLYKNNLGTVKYIVSEQKLQSFGMLFQKTKTIKKR